jgi:hypothetical protein
MRRLFPLLQLDMPDWWTATAEGYFARVNKEVILAALSEGAGAEAARQIKGVSKSELAPHGRLTARWGSLSRRLPRGVNRYR